jgi:hypothetical protein
VAVRARERWDLPQGRPIALRLYSASAGATRLPIRHCGELLQKIPPAREADQNMLGPWPAGSHARRRRDRGGLTERQSKTARVTGRSPMPGWITPSSRAIARPGPDNLPARPGFWEHLGVLSQADIYRVAMRLIEQYGDGADIAAMLRADALIQDDERGRKAVLSAIAELRGGNRSRAH